MHLLQLENSSILEGVALASCETSGNTEVEQCICVLTNVTSDRQALGQS